jgi:hypothetical protein
MDTLRFIGRTIGWSSFVAAAFLLVLAREFVFDPIHRRVSPRTYRPWQVRYMRPLEKPMEKLETRTFSVSWFEADEVRSVLNRRPHVEVKQRGFLRRTFTVTAPPRLLSAVMEDFQAWREERLVA